MNNNNSRSSAFNSQRHCCLCTEALWTTRASHTAPFCPVRLWNAVPHSKTHFLLVILSEEYGPFLKKVRQLNTDAKACSEFWSTYGCWGIWDHSVSPPERRHNGSDCSWAASAPREHTVRVRPAITCKDAVSRHLPFLFPNLLDWWWGKRRGNETTNGGDCRFGILMLFWHFSCPEDLLLYVVEPRRGVFSWSFSFCEEVNH